MNKQSPAISRRLRPASPTRRRDLLPFNAPAQRPQGVVRAGS
jgi:hypothetical protein